MPRFLMCRPIYFEVEYEINPWMNQDKPLDRDLAERQWDELRQTLESLPNVEIELIEPQAGLPDLVFTANAGVVKDKLFISSRFRHPERQGESPHFEHWFAEHGYQVKLLPNDLQFEGAGDMLKADGTWFGGYYFRTEPQALAVIAEMLGEEVLPLRLIDQHYYHLDTCFCPLDDSIMYYPGAFDEYATAVLREQFPDATEVTTDEAAYFSCNAVVVGNHIVMNKVSSRLNKIFSDRGFECHPVSLSEFIKAGGSVKCLTMRIEG